MNLETRLKKLEDVTGVNQPCYVCTPNRESAQAFNDYLEERGWVVQTPKRPHRYEEHCPRCGEAFYYDLSFLDAETRAEFLLLSEEDEKLRQAGLERSQELQRTWEALILRLIPQEREFYGEHYDDATIASHQLLKDRYGIIREWPILPTQESEVKENETI